MNPRESPLFWSFPCGVWWQTQVRVSVFFPLTVLLICYRLGNMQLGLLFSGLLFLSVLLHEFGHVIAARATGGSANEILLWPFGGLAYVQPAPGVRSHVICALGGPLVNLVLCVLLLPAVLASPVGWSILHPLRFPLHDLSGSLFSSICILGFFANWLQLLVNLVPVYPLDGGAAVRALLTGWFPRESAAKFYTRAGFVVAFAGMFIGMMIESTLLVFIGSILLMLNLLESLQLQSADSYDDSFMGYDFSQGYTSLERAEQAAGPSRPGALSRWLQQRRDARAEKQRERDAADERHLDQLLDKVHQVGMDGLSGAERRLLARVSSRLRARNSGSQRRGD